MATALDMITQSLRKIGVYAPSETLTDADAQQGLTSLNDMLDSWSNENLSTFALLQQSGTLVPGQQTYTIGPGGNFNTTRPLKIEDGPGRCYVVDSTGQNYPLDVIDAQRWNLLGQLNINSNIPTALYYDPQFPLANINIFPIPNIGYTLYWNSYLPLVDFSTLASVLSLPAGYKKAIQDCLCIELWPHFKADGAQIPVNIVNDASVAKANIKRKNMRPMIAFFDKEIVSRSTPTYNIYRDTGG